MTLLVLALVLSPLTGAAAAADSMAGEQPVADGNAPTESTESTESSETPLDDGAGLRPDIPPQQRLAEAGKAFNLGVEAFKEERYEDALLLFSQAQRLAPHPDTLYNLGLTQQLVGEHLQAWRSFEQLLAQTDDETEREELLAMQGQSRAHVVKLRVRLEPPQEVCFDGRPMPEQDGVQAVLTTPGEHRLDFDRGMRVLQLEGGETRMLELSVPPPLPPPPPRRRLRALSGLAIAGAGAAAGLGLGAGLVGDERLQLGLGAGAAAMGTMALTTTIVALVVHRRMRRWTPPPPRDPCPVPAR
ncbi:MAG: tetratricopeptide repeat protein [Nannocystaceae bacterium]